MREREERGEEEVGEREEKMGGEGKTPGRIVGELLTSSNALKGAPADGDHRKGAKGLGLSKL